MTSSGQWSRESTEVATDVDVVVVGAGISGLAFAHALTEPESPAAPVVERTQPCRVAIFEARPRVGGNLHTVIRDGFVVDEGADSWVSAKPEATALARRLGLSGRLIETVPENRRVYVAAGAELVPLPTGLVLGIPTQLGPVLRSKLLSPRGKARLLLDLLLPAHSGRHPQHAADEPLGVFLERRLGAEAASRLVGPLLGGLYSGDASRLSLQSTFPQLRALEEEAGSLMRGARRRARRLPAVGGTFTSLRGGLGELISALRARLAPHLVEDTPVTQCVQEGDGYRVFHRHGSTRTRHLVVTGPTYVAASVLHTVDDELAAELKSICYSSTSVVFVGFPREAVPHALDGSGYLLPKDGSTRTDLEGRGPQPLAATWISSKWRDRAPPGQVLLRVFFGHPSGGQAPESLASDDELLERTRRELHKTLHIQAEPSFVHVARFPLASPQPLVGHETRLEKLRTRLSRHDGLHLLGSAYRGVGIADCIREAEQLAQRLRQAARAHGTTSGAARSSPLPNTP